MTTFGICDLPDVAFHLSLSEGNTIRLFVPYDSRTLT